MNKTTHQAASAYYALVGILFLLAATRDVYSFGAYFSWVLCVGLLVGIVVSWKMKAVWVAFYQYVLVLFYNPLVISHISGKNSSLADVIIGLSLFLIGLHLQTFVQHQNDN